MAGGLVVGGVLGEARHYGVEVVCAVELLEGCGVAHLFHYALAVSVQRLAERTGRNAGRTEVGRNLRLGDALWLTHWAPPYRRTFSARRLMLQ